MPSLDEGAGQGAPAGPGKVLYTHEKHVPGKVSRRAVPPAGDATPFRLKSLDVHAIGERTTVIAGCSQSWWRRSRKLAATE